MGWNLNGSWITHSLYPCLRKHGYWKSVRSSLLTHQRALTRDVCMLNPFLVRGMFQLQRRSLKLPGYALKITTVRKGRNTDDVFIFRACSQHAQKRNNTCNNLKSSPVITTDWANSCCDNTSVSTVSRKSHHRRHRVGINSWIWIYTTIGETESVEFPPNW